VKISYKVLKDYISDIKSPEDVAQDLIMHTAEVEDIIYEGDNLKWVFIWEVKTCEKHPDSEKLNCTTVEVSWKIYPIVCGAPNVKAGIKVPVALVWAQLAPDFTISKTKIRGEVSEWMICSEDELWLNEERQIGILELPTDAPLGMNMREYLQKDDAILEVDNKAINHRPDLFSHIWIIRELYAINGQEFEFEYAKKDFSKLPDLGIKNDITDVVTRYIGLQINGVKNIESPEYIKQILLSADTTSKWILIDISNYALYLYGQPTHCFDADKIEWNITIRYATQWEKFLALNDSEYELSTKDIVIADDSKVLALGWIIGWKESSVSDATTSIIIESAHFDQAIIRKTWKKLWIRTDSLNVFEKDIVNGMQDAWISLIVTELEKNLDWISLISYSDIYPNIQKELAIPHDVDFINKIIWSNYSEIEILSILENLWIQLQSENLIIPFWRKDLVYKADIAEEIARIHGYNNVVATVPRINLWAISQTNTYKIKNDAKDFFCNTWFFDMYTYSFVNLELMEKLDSDVSNLVPMKNPLSEELSHMRWSLIPNLMLSLEKNIRDFDTLKLFEIEKVFKRADSDIMENYSIAWVTTNKGENVYYEIQNIVSNFLLSVWVDKFHFDSTQSAPSYSHWWRVASLIVRGKAIGTLWEVHPKIAKNFDLKERVWFFEININELESSLYSKVKSKEISEFQENNFDLNFVVDKNIKWKDIHSTIEKANNEIINKVELIDIYENEDKFPWKRSLTFKIFIQSMEKTLDDKIKNELIQEIIKKVEKKGWELR